MHPCFGCIEPERKDSQQRKPIVLDDEYAFVHLGRFIDIVHSKSYQDSVCIGFTAVAPSLDTPLFKGKEVSVSCELFFKTTLRTQETFIEKALIKAGPVAFDVVYTKAQYQITNNRNKQTVTLSAYGLTGLYGNHERRNERARTNLILGTVPTTAAASIPELQLRSERSRRHGGVDRCASNK